MLYQRLVVLFRKVQRIVRLKFPHFTNRHFVGHTTHHPQRNAVAQLDQFDHGAGVQIISHDHRHLVTEHGVDRGLTPAQHRVINRVIVNQSGEVNEFDDRRQRHVFATHLPRRLSRQQQQGRPKHLALHAEQVLVDLGDQWEIGDDDASEFFQNLIQLVPDRLLDCRHVDRCKLRRHAQPCAFDSAFTRSPTS